MSRKERRWKERTASAPRAFTFKEKLRNVALAIMMVASQVAGALGFVAATPTTALADEVITGTCYEEYQWRDHPAGEPFGWATMPDGKKIKVHCYEEYLGVDGFPHYGWPVDGNYSFTATKQADGSYFVVIDSSNAAIHWWVLEGWNNYIPGWPAQRMYGVWEPELDGWLSIAKTSSNEAITNGNDAYSLEGAWFHVYKDGSDWSQAGLEASTVGWMFTKDEHDEYGRRVAKAYNWDKPTEDWLTLPEGTYWVREEWADNGDGMPEGYELGPESDYQYEGYKCGPWVKVTITANETTWADNRETSDEFYGMPEGFWYEKPKNDPLRALVKKVDAENADDAQGNGTLGGAQFTVKYYDNIAGTTSGTPERTWVFETDEDGYTEFTSAYLATGDELYKDENGLETMPLGTYTIQETKAPDGYLISDNSVHKLVLKDVVDGEGVWDPEGWDSTFYDEDFEGRAVADQIKRGGVEGVKIDHKRNQAIPQGDATLAGAKIGIYSDNEKVFVNGVPYEEGDLVLTLTTKADGTYASGAEELPFGYYTARELEPPTGYLLNETWAESFEVKEQGKRVKLTPVTETPITGGATFTKIDHDLKEGVAQGDATLAGAELSIYNISAESVEVGGTFIAPAASAKRADLLAATPVLKVMTDADGAAATPANALVYGRYAVIETKAPKGYELNEEWVETFEIRAQGEEEPVAPEPEKVTRGGVEVVKVDADSLSITPQGDATLEGAEFGIRNISKADVFVNGATHAPSKEITIITTDGDSVAKTAAYLLPYGTYEIYEKTPPTGYLPNPDWKITIEVREHGVVVDGGQIADNVVRGGVAIAKIDAERDSNVAQGDATLEGAVVNVYNVSKENVYVNGEWIAPATGTSREELLASAPALTLVTDAEGKAASADDALPYGRYVAIEIESSEGYKLNEGWMQHFTVAEHKHVYELEYLGQKVVRGDVVLAKTDAETGGHLPLGEGRFEGVEFTITNVSDGSGDDGILYEGKSEIAKGETVTIVTDVNGIARTEGGALPFGTYTYEETENPYGYMPFPGGSGTFQIREDGVVVNGATNEPVKVDESSYPVDIEAISSGAENQVVRGEIYFNKVVLSSQRELVGVPFKLTAIATGESHIVVTDANGMFDSTDFDEGMRTNANDEAVTPVAASSTYVDPDTGETVTNPATYGYEVDESKLDPEQGVWFAGRTDIDNPQNEALAALPVGTYMLEELPCSANEGLTLIQRTFTIKANQRNYGQKKDLGTINNLDEPALGTKLATVDGAKTVSGTGTVKLVDTVAYENLVRGESYRIYGTIVAVDADGNMILTNSVGDAAFTANRSEGEAKVEYEVNLDILERAVKLVCFEKLFDADNVLKAKHENIDDADQTVKIVEIGTTLTGEEGEKEVLATTPMKLIDTIAYKGLEPGKTYTATGELYDKATGKSLGVTGTADFTPEKATGTAKVEFVIDDARIVIGKSVVAFEEVWDGKVLVGIHADLEDPDQTVTVPKIGTTLADDEGAKVVEATVVNLVDTVTYEMLEPGGDYTATGELHLTDGENDLGVIEGTQKEINFTASETGNGTFEMGFELDASALDGKSVVAFERVWTAKPGEEEGGDKLVAEHADPSDPGQTVKINQPDIQTTLVDEKGNKVVAADETFTLIDTIAYVNLEPGAELTAKGELHQFDEDGKDLGVVSTAQIEFTVSETGNGSVDVPFIVRAADLKSTKIVAFEKVGKSDFMGIMFTEVAVHEDPNDPGQTVTVPEIGTTLTGEEGEKEILAATPVKLIDTIAYKGLEPGKTYTATGELMDKASGESTGIKAEATFTASETGAGTATVVFQFDGKIVAGKSVVAFEKVFDENREVAVHAEIDDPDQTVNVPKIGTTLTGAKSEKEILSAEKIELIDTIAYEGLTPGKTYTAVGELMDKATGKSLGIKSEPVEFTAKDANGTVQVKFTVDGKLVAGKSVVAYETVMEEGREVAIHADINDEAQTVTVPKIGTSLTNKKDGSRKAAAAGNVTLVDKVTYEGLVPGAKYKTSGELMDKATGKSTGIKAEKEFTASANGSGTVDLSFAVDASKYGGKSLVAFETAYNAEGKVVAVHKDINDGNQTVVFNTPTTGKNTPTPKTVVNTGDDSPVGFIAACAIAGAAAFVARAKIMRRDEESATE